MQKLSTSKNKTDLKKTEKKAENGKSFQPKTETLNKILEAESKGFPVYMGELRSDNNEIEGFFCTDYFIIDDKRLYIDATNDGW